MFVVILQSQLDRELRPVYHLKGCRYTQPFHALSKTVRLNRVLAEEFGIPCSWCQPDKRV